MNLGYQRVISKSMTIDPRDNLPYIQETMQTGYSFWSATPMSISNKSRSATYIQRMMKDALSRMTELQFAQRYRTRRRDNIQSEEARMEIDELNRLDNEQYQQTSRRRFFMFRMLEEGDDFDAVVGEDEGNGIEPFDPLMTSSSDEGKTPNHKKQKGRKFTFAPAKHPSLEGLDAAIKASINVILNNIEILDMKQMGAIDKDQTDLKSLNKHMEHQYGLLVKTVPGHISGIVVAQASNPGMVHISPRELSIRVVDTSDKISTEGGQKKTLSLFRKTNQTMTDQYGTTMVASDNPHSEPSRQTCSRQVMMNLTNLALQSPNMVSSQSKRVISQVSSYDNIYVDPKTPTTGQVEYDAKKEMPMTWHQMEVLHKTRSSDLIWKPFMAAKTIARKLAFHFCSLPIWDSSIVMNDEKDELSGVLDSNMKEDMKDENALDLYIKVDMKDANMIRSNVKEDMKDKDMLDWNIGKDMENANMIDSNVKKDMKDKDMLDWNIREDMKDTNTVNEVLSSIAWIERTEFNSEWITEMIIDALTAIVSKVTRILVEQTPNISERIFDPTFTDIFSREWTICLQRDLSLLSQIWIPDSTESKLFSILSTSDTTSIMKQQITHELDLYHNFINHPDTPLAECRELLWYTLVIRHALSIHDSLLYQPCPLLTPDIYDMSKAEVEVHKDRLLRNGKVRIWSNRKGGWIPGVCQAGFVPMFRVAKFGRGRNGYDKHCNEPSRDPNTLQPTRSRELDGASKMGYMDLFCILGNNGDELYYERISHSDTVIRFICMKCKKLAYETDTPLGKQRNCDSCDSGSHVVSTMINMYVQNQHQHLRLAGIRFGLDVDITTPADVPIHLNTRPRTIHHYFIPIFSVPFNFF
jgi:hypothetical protein